MTTTDVDPVREFRDALPAALRAHLNITTAVVASIHTAVREHHWTPTHLAQEATRNLADVQNPAAVITDRLRRAAQHPPVGHDTTSARRKPVARPFCSDDCRDRAGYIEDDHGHPIGRCPCRTSTPEATN